ncbi:hypothetical protein Mapa_006399 [Marchantia paleacea]|nr:hypothetical protein Mapa_006399 [Marchantia paleacea]
MSKTGPSMLLIAVSFPARTQCRLSSKNFHICEAMASEKMSITTICFLLATAWMIAGAAAAKDYTVSCTTSSDSSPIWKDAHKAVNVIRKEPLSSERCCQINENQECTVLVQVNSAVIKMCQPLERVLCTRCDWAGSALLDILRTCIEKDESQKQLFVSGTADFNDFYLSVEKAAVDEAEPKGILIEMKTWE